MHQLTKLKSTVNRFALSALAVVFLAGSASPIVAFADDPSTTTTTPATSSTAPAATTTTVAPTTTSDPTTTTPAATPTSPAPATTGPTTQPGPNAPTGPDANTYTYNASTGLWENQYYTWNPVTGQTTPKVAPTYSYNPATGMWDTTQWKYDPASGTYVPNVVAVASPPAGAVTTVPADTTGSTTASSSGSGSSSGGSGALDTPSTAIVPNSLSSLGSSTGGTNGSTGITLGSSNDTTFDNFYNAGISNALNSNAVSGNAIVMGNTTGGSAQSGDANDDANILNMLQSTASLLGNNAATFVSNIYGDVQGDILINPTNITQPTTDASTVNNDFALNSQNSGQINNNINLDAASGDATVSKNTSGGNATSGNASAVANVVNMLNSMIASNQSFLGVVNIYGNLTGNINVPQEFMNQLLATNAPTTTIDASAINQFSSTANNNQSINNNVTTNATSGSANVADNTTAGSATTGTSSNKVTVFNLTGSQFIGADTLLVFVNVMGQWIGVMMNAPAGTTAAAYGSGVASNTTATAANTANVNVNNNQSINNNIRANATTGNADVSDNTTAGNAKSGNASTAVNLLNLTNDQFSLSNWFGVLFINVFGNWYGNFGVSKPVVASAATGSTTTGSPTTSTGVKVFRFVPSSSGNGTTDTTSSTTPTTASTPTSGEFQLANTKLANELKALTPKPTTPAAPSSAQGISLAQIIGAGIFAGGLSLFGIDHYMKQRAAHHSL